ncbi:hypothetical protein FAES_1929 [Fibrella aestuarina BUZ 2]|uniref:Uncharacterized protein n=1 Tax=Fibrella aestuarina BUZ 2 TaxID=1166018 RepID=I0K735_9BACT|nr:type VI secretion system baseplate subunit TssF [Fibrella aestuarina]CCG99938.1 hypothetical protein FAES_1929 [Fibrella aestuarina BUZ 2]
MNQLTAKDFTRDEIRKRMIRYASAIWQMRGKDVEATDPLVSYLMEACAFELENTAKAIEQTRGHIVNRLASVMCPEVIDLPRPAHAIFHARPDDFLLDLDPSVQFYHRPPVREGVQRDVFFSPVVKSRLANGEVRFLVSEQGITEFRGFDRMQWEKQAQPTFTTPYQSVWIGLELDDYVPSIGGLPLHFDWESESPQQKAVYYRKLHDGYQSTWHLNGQPIPVYPGFISPDTHAAHLGPQLDVLHLLEQDVLNLYSRSFMTLGNVPTRDDWGLARSLTPPGYLFNEQQTRLFGNRPLIWLELRLSRDFPPLAVANMDVRMNCFPVMNRQLNRMQQRLSLALNVYPLKSDIEFLFIRRVYDADSKDLFRSSPLRDFDELEEDSFMWRPHDVGRFDERNAHDLLQQVQQLLLDENRAFRALGSGWFVKTLDELKRNLDDLGQQLQAMPTEGFKMGHPYIFIKPRRNDSNVFVEFWSTNGKSANYIPAGTYLSYYGGYDSIRTGPEDLFLVTGTVGGQNKPSVDEKEYHLRQTLLTRQRLVTIADIEAECKAYFFGRLGGIPVDVQVQKAFAENLIEGAGYVRCLDVVIVPRSRTNLTPTEWDAECDRCQQHLAARSAMNLPYRVRMQATFAPIRTL